MCSVLSVISIIQGLLYSKMPLNRPDHSFCLEQLTPFLPYPSTYEKRNDTANRVIPLLYLFFRCLFKFCCSKVLHPSLRTRSPGFRIAHLSINRCTGIAVHTPQQFKRPIDPPCFRRPGRTGRYNNGSTAPCNVQAYPFKTDRLHHAPGQSRTAGSVDINDQTAVRRLNAVKSRIPDLILFPSGPGCSDGLRLHFRLRRRWRPGFHCPGIGGKEHRKQYPRRYFMTKSQPTSPLSLAPTPPFADIKGLFCHRF